MSGIFPETMEPSGILVPETGESDPDFGGFEIPGFDVIRIIGRGGMGIVYGARQIEPARHVAIKMLASKMMMSPSSVRRFRNEAETMALLDHPGILPVYTVGEYAGVPFFVMKRVTGGSLAGRLANQALPVPSGRQAVEWVLRLAEAVSHAHQRGVLHRDLKPSNALFDESGSIYLTDFGLAKALSPGPDDFALTQDTTWMGTPTYLAPELATAYGQPQRAATVATDVYGLGIILYEVLVGVPPFQAGDLPTLLYMVAEMDPPEIPRRDGLTDARTGSVEGLRAIVRCSLEKDPKKRYATADAMARDLQAWLEGLPLAVVPQTSLDRAVRWVRRHRVFTTVMFAALITLTSVAVGTWQTRVARLRDDLRRRFNYVADMNRAHQAWLETNGMVFDRSMDDAAAADHDGTLRGIEWGLLREMADASAGRVLFKAPQPLHAIAVGSSPARIAVLGSSNLFVLDEAGMLIRSRSAAMNIGDAAIAFAGSSGWIATSGSSGIQLHPPDDNPPVWVTTDSNDLIAVSADGRRLAATSRTPSGTESPMGVLIFDISNPHQPVALRQFQDIDGLALAWTSNGSQLQILERRGGLRTWSDGEVGHSSKFFGVHRTPTGIFSPNGTLQASANVFGTVLIVEPQSGRLVASWPGYPPHGVRMAFSSDATSLALTGVGNAIEVQAIPNGQGIESAPKAAPLRFLPGHHAEITALVWEPGDEGLLSVSRDGSVRRSFPRRSPVPGYFEIPHDLWIGAFQYPVFSSDSRYLLLGEKINNFRQPERLDLPRHDTSMIWDLEKRVVRSRIEGQPMAWNGSTECMTWDSDRKIRIWSLTHVDAPRLTHEFRILDSNLFMRGPTLADEGRWVLTVAGDETFHAFRVADQTFHRVRGGERVDFAIGSPLFPTAAVSIGSNSVALMDLNSGRTTKLADGIVGEARFSPSGRRVVVSDMNRGLRVFDAQNGMLESELSGQTGAIMSMAFASNERRLVVGGDDYSLAIWDLSTRRETLRMQVDAPIYWIAVSPDDRWLVTGYFPNHAGLTLESRKPGRYRIWPIASMSEVPALKPPRVSRTSIWAMKDELMRTRSH